MATEGPHAGEGDGVWSSGMPPTTVRFRGASPSLVCAGRHGPTQGPLPP